MDPQETPVETPGFDYRSELKLASDILTGRAEELPESRDFGVAEVRSALYQAASGIQFASRQLDELSGKV